MGWPSRRARPPVHAAPAPAPIFAAPACNIAAPAVSADRERNERLLYPSLSYCARCDVQWAGAGPCWCCPPPGRVT